MKPILKKVRLCILAAATAVLLSGCLFQNSLSVSVDEDTDLVSISAGGDPPVDIGTCVEGAPGFYACRINSAVSNARLLTTQELIFILIMLDPVVVQLPADITNFNGSYFHLDSSTGGALAITAGLGSVAIDVDRTLTAEPGTQLVVIGLPTGVPTTGSFNFNLNFEVPPGTTQIEAKPIITGFVELTDGSRFYPPLLPCVDNMADAPVLNIPLPVPGDTLALPPLTPDLGCDNVTYNFISGGTAPAPRTIPVLGLWSFLVLTVLLGGVGSVWLRRRRRL